MDRTRETMPLRFVFWSPGIVHGLFQTEDYARAMFVVHPSVTDEVVTARLASRMERQRRVLLRDDPPEVAAVIDHVALYRCVGSPEVMATQCQRLLEVSRLPHVTLQVLPAVAHPGTASELILADNAAYAEHLAAGGVYTEEATVTHLERVFAALRAECYRASESAAIIRKAGQTWTGESRPTAEATGPA